MGIRTDRSRGTRLDHPTYRPVAVLSTSCALSRVNRGLVMAGLGAYSHGEGRTVGNDDSDL